MTSRQAVPDRRLPPLPLLLLTLLALTPATAAAQTAPAARIVVEGHGRLELPPDLAVVRVTIETRAESPDAAAAANAERQEAVLAALRGAGAEGGDLATVGYGVQPNWQWRDGERYLDGYVARTTLRARTSDLDRVGGWIDAAIDAGADQIEGVSFELSDPETARREALTVAVRNARRDAEAMAAAAGGRLGALLELSTGSGRPPSPEPMMRTMAAESSTDTRIVAGEQTVTATVTASWTFVPDGS